MFRFEPQCMCEFYDKCSRMHSVGTSSGREKTASLHWCPWTERIDCAGVEPVPTVPPHIIPPSLTLLPSVVYRKARMIPYHHGREDSAPGRDDIVRHFALMKWIWDVKVVCWCCIFRVPTAIGMLHGVLRGGRSLILWHYDIIRHPQKF